MKIAIYNPYLDTMGGGERYTFSFAKLMLNSGHSVDIQWSDGSILKRVIERFGIDLSGATVLPDINRGDGYDITFWVSDGSVPTLRSRKNLLHFQVPFHDVGGSSLLNKMKFFRINNIVCNSYFTKKIIDFEYGVSSDVIYPPVDTDEFVPKRKENVILYVGRFSNLKQSKHQDILVNCFKKIYDSGIKNWKLVLAGGSEVGNNGYVANLKMTSVGYPIKIIESPSLKILKDLYGNAKIFWSASGFGEDEEINPESVEHFGMTVVEAMSAKCLPIVFDAGGHKEIVDNTKDGYLWKTEDELVNLTKDLIKKPKLINNLVKNAKIKSSNFDLNRFENDFLKLII